MTAIPFTVGADVVLSDVPEKTAARITFAFSVTNPKRAQADRFGFHVGADVPEDIEFAIEMPDGLHVPRGAFQRVKELAAKDGHALQKIGDERVDGKSHDFGAVNLPLWPHQAEGVAMVRKHLQGTIVLPCGTGKSRLGIGIILAISRTTLVTVPTIDLLEQWVTSIYEFLPARVDEYQTVGYLGGGKEINLLSAPIIVAVDDSLTLRRANDGWFRRFGLAIVDEAHHCATPTMRTIMERLPAKYRVGLTATPQREDGLERAVDWIFGPRLLERSTKQMIAQGYLCPAEIEFVDTGFSWEWKGRADDPKRTHDMEEKLAGDAARNWQIGMRALDEGKAGHSTLVLANRKSMTDALMRIVAEDGGIDCRLVTSKTAKKKRKTLMEEFKAGKFPVLVATSLADEGLDMPRLSRILLAFPHGARTGTTQRLGRLLRKWPGKKPKLIDFVDKRIPSLENRASGRRRVYRAAGLIE